METKQNLIIMTTAIAAVSSLATLAYNSKNQEQLNINSSDLDIIKSVGRSANIEEFFFLENNFKDTQSNRTNLLNILKKLIIEKITKTTASSSSSIVFDDEILLYQTDQTGFFAFISKCLYELQIKKII